MHKEQLRVLRVEGRDDKFVIRSLLERHNVDYKNIEIKQSDRGNRNEGGKGQLLKGMRTAVETSTGTSIGFVLDADQAPEDPWRAVRGRLYGIGLDLAKEIPEVGYVGYAKELGVRVGVWMMPDNRRSGSLEVFLEGLVKREDRLFDLARRSTAIAKKRGAAFPQVRKDKAVLHTWLAWQERPGVPYGTAITAGFLSYDSSAAQAFVVWFRRVFEGPVP